MKQKIKKFLIALFGTTTLFGCSSVAKNSSNEIDALELGVLKADFGGRKKEAGEEIKYEIAGHNLALESSINIIYYVEQNNVNCEKGLLVWDGVASSYTQDTATYKLSKEKDPFIYGGHTYDVYIFDKVAAKRMSDYFYARPYEYKSDTYVLYNLDRYSVIDYAYKFKDSEEKLDEGSSITLKTAIAAILNYGGTIQQLFNYKMERCVLKPFHEIQLKNCLFCDDNFPSRLCFEDETISFVAWTGIDETLYDYYDRDKGTLQGDITTQRVSITLEDFNCDRFYGARLVNLSYFDIEQYTLKEYKGNEEDVHVYGNVGLLSFNKIARGAFKDNPNIKYIRIPSTITEIEAGAFTNLPNLKVVYIDQENKPDGWNIDDIFVNCSPRICYRAPFSGADFPLDRGSLIRYIGTNPDVDIPSTVELLNVACFENLPITSVSFPDDMRWIPEKCFKGCDLLKTVKFNDVVKIGKVAFEKCSNLSNVYITKTITLFDDYPFQGADGVIVVEYSESELRQYGAPFQNYKGDVIYEWTNPDTTWIYDSFTRKILKYNGDDEVAIIPEHLGIMSIESYAFNSLPNLKKVVLSSEVATLKSYAFANNPNLESINLCCVKKFKNSPVFANNPKLTNLYIPSSLVSFDPGTFYSNDNPSGDITFYCEFPSSECKNLPNNWLPEVVDHVVYDCGNPDNFIVSGTKIVGYNKHCDIICIPGKVGDVVITEISKNATFPSSPKYILFLSPNVTIKSGCLNNVNADICIFISKNVVTVEDNIGVSSTRIESDVMEVPASWNNFLNIMPASLQGCTASSDFLYIQP